MKKDITVTPGITIMEAMKLLDKTAEKILLVVDDGKKLIGALTDGDIRRHILKFHDLNDTIEKVYNPDPSFVYQETINQKQIKKIFTRVSINLIPILDRNRVVVDYITLKDVFGETRKTEKQKVPAPAVIMAGGKGTRLKPFTQILPKPLIPIGDKTVLDHIIDRFRIYGVNDFYLSVNHMSRIIRAYFEEKNPDYTIAFVEENEPKGTAGSLKLMKGRLKVPFFVSNCDIIIEADYFDVYQFHKNGRYDITLVAAAKKFSIPYGVCELSTDSNLKNIREKPEYNFLVNTGLYVLNPEMLEMIPDQGLFHMTYLIEQVKQNKGTVGVYPVSESSWIDVGQWEEYRNALKVIEGF